jgi:uncharacterized repeat protein (TIGR03803 family)
VELGGFAESPSVQKKNDAKTNYMHIQSLKFLTSILGLMLAVHTSGQTFSTLWTFSGGSDGANPYGNLILSSNTLYGTAAFGGSAGQGTVFAINTDGTGFTNLYTFTNGTDGAIPSSGLVLSGSTLYGTAEFGGSVGDGTVFGVNTDGTDFTNLHTFNLSDGAHPQAGLLLAGNTLLGMATFGGNAGHGTVFAVNLDGTGFTNLYNFTASSYNPNVFSQTNSDGYYPSGGFIREGNTLYGTASSGGYFGSGIVFAINTDGTGFTNLYNFSAGGINNDGAYPYDTLTLSGDTLYGTTANGGTAGNGTVFALNTDGTDFTNLHNFSALNNYTNEDGANPSAGLVLSGRTLYGVGYNGGVEGYGMVFALDTSGSDFVDLYDFVGVPPFPGPYTNSAGTYPYGGLLLSGNNLYGTGNYGGNSGNGTVFKLVIPITLFYQNIGNAIVYSWNDPSFVLQSAPTLTGTYTNIASATSPYTNSITSVQRYFRLLVSQ